MYNMERRREKQRNWYGKSLPGYQNENVTADNIEGDGSGGATDRDGEDNDDQAVTIIVIATMTMTVTR